MLFSKRRELQKQIEERAAQVNLPLCPFNVITLLDGWGWLRQEQGPLPAHDPVFLMLDQGDEACRIAQILEDGERDDAQETDSGD